MLITARIFLCFYAVPICLIYFSMARSNPRPEEKMLMVKSLIAAGAAVFLGVFNPSSIGEMVYGIFFGGLTAMEMMQMNTAPPSDFFHISMRVLGINILLLLAFYGFIRFIF